MSTGCSAGPTEAPTSCQDGARNGGETDVDCGPGCAPCRVGQGCTTAADCKSGICAAGSCSAPPACDDGQRSGGESDVDCGGGCGPCGLGQGCAAASDCGSHLCAAGTCAAPPSCSDGLRNGDETDRDCGGGCGPCPDGGSCTDDRDCASLVCLSQRCAPAACGAQNLVVLVGAFGAHGYGQLLWPHPNDLEPARLSEELPVAFLQTSAATGAVGSSLGGQLAGVVDYTDPPARAARSGSTVPLEWARGERFKLLYGVDNLAFGGFRSRDAASRTSDQGFYGSDTIPTNAVMPKDRKWIPVSRETPWIERYGLQKSMTIVDGGTVEGSYIGGANNAWISYQKGWTVVAAAASEQVVRGAPVPVVVMGSLDSYWGTPRARHPFYGPAVPPGAPTALASASLGALLTDLARRTGVPEDELSPTTADRARYGFTSGTPAKLVELRDRLIVTAKLLRRGLTSSVTMSYFADGPTESLFTAAGEGGINAATAAAALRNFYDAFMDDLMAAEDPACPQRKLGDNTVIILVGDTPQDGVCKNWTDTNYPSGTQNRMWILSGGLLRTGAFGGDRPRSRGERCPGSLTFGAGEGGLYDLTTGDLIPFVGATTGGSDQRQLYGEVASAAVLYSVVRGRMERVRRYYDGPDFPALRAAAPPR